MQIPDYKKLFGEKLQENFPLSQLTTLGIGGLAKGLIKSQTKQEMIEMVKTAEQHQVPYLVIGGGSNLLVSDEGTNQLIIKNEILGISKQGSLVNAKSGTRLQEVVDFTIQHSLAGMEKLTGIPGSLGGAIYGNAGAYGQTISDHLVSVLCWNGEKEHKLSKKDCRFLYRDSAFKINHYIILEANFELTPNNPQILSSQSQEILDKRLAKYPPGLKCPGSFFKNVVANDLPQATLKLIPKENITFGKISAGYFLEAVGGLKQRRGQIEIANYHANLFFNLGHGTARDFYDLATELAIKVEAKFGIKLEPEVQFVNLPPLPHLTKITQ